MLICLVAGLLLAIRGMAVGSGTPSTEGVAALIKMTDGIRVRDQIVWINPIKRSEPGRRTTVEALLRWWRGAMTRGERWDMDERAVVIGEKLGVVLVAARVFSGMMY